MNVGSSDCVASGQLEKCQEEEEADQDGTRKLSLPAAPEPISHSQPKPKQGPDVTSRQTFHTLMAHRRRCSAAGRRSAAYR